MKNDTSQLGLRRSSLTVEDLAVMTVAIFNVEGVVLGEPVDNTTAVT